MRYHINTYWPNGTMADSTSFDTLADAEARLDMDKRRDDIAYRKALVRYQNELHDFLFDLELAEPVRPQLNPMGLRHKVEPCPTNGVKCIACHESGYDDGVTQWA
jgi:hypothetical protein